MKKNRWELMLGLMMLFVVALVAGKGFETVDASVAGEAEKVWTVVVDAGHAGIDPGKVGINGVLEKDINLAIATQLAAYLEAQGVQVIMTRTDDTGLYKETDSNKKRAELQARCDLIEESGADFVVSVHQNSYHDGSIQGPQVFYYTHSEGGKVLAESIQNSFADLVGNKNRSIKANSEYYLLLHVGCPVVIVECGFLSNWEEAELLKEEYYQDQVALTIHNGVMDYIKLQESGN